MTCRDQGVWLKMALEDCMISEMFSNTSDGYTYVVIYHGIWKSVVGGFFFFFSILVFFLIEKNPIKIFNRESKQTPEIFGLW